MNDTAATALKHRTHLLGNACALVRKLRAQGVNLGQAWRKAARAYNGRPLPGGRRLACSTKTLIRYCYRTEEGMKPEAFQDRRIVHEREPIAPRDLVRELNKLALRNGLSCVELFQRVGGARQLGFSLPTLCRVIDPHVKRAVRQRREVDRLCVLIEQRMEKGAKGENGGKEGGGNVGAKLAGQGAGRGFNPVCTGVREQRRGASARAGIAPPAGSRIVQPQKKHGGY